MSLLLLIMQNPLGLPRQWRSWVVFVNMSIHVTSFCDGKMSKTALVTVIKNKCRCCYRTFNLSFCVGDVFMLAWC